MSPPLFSFSMHSPMQSFGDSSTQPSTPISASGECGGRRSIVPADDAEERRTRFVRFKSVELAPSSETESIMSVMSNRIWERDNAIFRTAYSNVTDSHVLISFDRRDLRAKLLTPQSAEQQTSRASETETRSPFAPRPSALLRGVLRPRREAERMDAER